MKYHLTGFTASAFLHVGLFLLVMPWLLWQDKQQGMALEPQPVALSLAQFRPVPQTLPAEIPVPKSESLVPAKPKLSPKRELKVKSKPRKTKRKSADKSRSAARPQTKKAEAVTQSTSRPTNPVYPQAVVARPQPVPATRPVPPVPQASNRQAEAAYRARLQRLIAARKRYPPQAVADEAEGGVMVAFTVLPNGSISNIRVVRGSGNSWLDRAAVQAVKAASGALPFPPEIHKPQWVFQLLIAYRLE